MSSLLTAPEAINSIPGWSADAVVIEELKGGLTNRTFMVIRGTDTFVLRLDAVHTAAFNLDRASETAILTKAASAGMAPNVVFADSSAGILLCEYLPGQVWSVDDLKESARIDSLCDLLRRVHDLPLSGIRFDPLAVANRYVKRLESRQGLHSYALRCEEIISKTPLTGLFVCCHNDVIAQNIIATPALKLLDWEYACDNDPFFDLASLIGYHNLDEGLAKNLLDAYSGGTNAELHERLRQQVRLYDAIQWLWLANRHMLVKSSEQAARLENLQQRIG